MQDKYPSTDIIFSLIFENIYYNTFKTVLQDTCTCMMKEQKNKRNPITYRINETQPNR